MGLDMYLTKAKNIKDKTFEEIIEINRRLENLDDKNLTKEDEILMKENEIHLRGNFIHWHSLFTEVGYWRKANAIHNWFVENVQDGIDECQLSLVSKEDLEELLSICKTVLETNQTDLLSIQSGFFFGSTNYDEWYYKDIEDTIKILEEVLANTDFDNEIICYQSSW